MDAIIVGRDFLPSSTVHHQTEPGSGNDDRLVVVAPVWLYLLVRRLPLLGVDKGKRPLFCFLLGPVSEPPSRSWSAAKVCQEDPFRC